MKYWLMKTEPDVFSIQDLKKKKKNGWDGVRNYQARNYMRDEMRVGDEIFFYHSSCEIPGIAGLARVSRESHPDPTQFDKKSEYYDAKATKEKPIWFMVEVEFVKELPQMLTLESLKKDPELKELRLLQKGSRLSVQPVSEDHWNYILKTKIPSA